MGKINIGVIGCGDVALLQYLPVIKNSGKFNLVALCDKDQKRLIKVAKFFEVNNIFNSHQEMLKSGLIQAAVNLTPATFHYIINLDCLNAKIHTYSEKPVSLKIKEIENLIKVSREKKVKFACAPSIPLNPIVEKTKHLLDEGAIGKPCYAIGFGSHGGPASQSYISYYKNTVKHNKLFGFEELSTDPTWFYEQGGGPLEDLGVYILTALIFLFGPAKNIQCLSGLQNPEVKVTDGIARGKKIKVKIDDCTLMLLEFNNGTYASISSSYCVKGTKMPDIEIYGSEGTISISDYYTKLEVYLERNGGLAAWNIPYEDLSGYYLGKGVEYLAECILDDKEPIINATFAKHVTEIILKAPQASSSGKKILINSKI
jgi:predicted dehydrogenase